MTLSRLFDPALILYTLIIWMVTMLVAVITIAVYTLEYGASNGGSPSLWLMSLLMWGAIIYTFCEFAVQVIYRIAQGDEEFPVLSTEVLSFKSGRKKLLSTVLLFAALGSAYIYFDRPFYEFFQGSFWVLLTVFAPALLITLAISDQILHLVDIPLSIKMMFRLGWDYVSALLLLVALVSGSIYLYHQLSTGVFAIYFFVAIYLANLYLLYLGSIAHKHHDKLGLTPERYELEENQQLQANFESELNLLANQSYSLCSENKINQALPKFYALIRKSCEQGLNEIDIWTAVWQRIEEWHDQAFISEFAIPYLDFLLGMNNYKDAAKVVSPLLKGRRFPFKSTQLFFKYCELAIKAGDFSNAQLALESAQVVFKGKAPHAKTLLMLVKLCAFQLQNEPKAQTLLSTLKSEFPQLKNNPEVQKISNLLQV